MELTNKSKAPSAMKNKPAQLPEAIAIAKLIENNLLCTENDIRSLSSRRGLPIESLLRLMYFASTMGLHDIANDIRLKILRRSNIDDKIKTITIIISARRKVRKCEISFLNQELANDGENEILQIAADRLIEKLCTDKRFVEAADLLKTINSNAQIQNERASIRELIASIISYRLGKVTIDSLIENQNRILLLQQTHFPLAYCYNAIFTSFLSMLKSGAHYQVHFPLTFEKALERIDYPPTRNKLKAVMDSLSNIQGSLPERIWSIVPPFTPSQHLEKRCQFSFHSPESLFFDQARTALTDLESLNRECHIEKLENAVKQAKQQGADCWAARLTIQILIIHLNSQKLISNFERTKLRLFASSYKNYEVAFFLRLLDCAYAYRTGQRKQFHNILSELLSYPYQGFVTKILPIWSDIACGNNKEKNIHIDQYSLKITKLIFNPCITITGRGKYRIGNIEEIDLNSKPILNKIFEVLLRQKNRKIRVEDLQEIVWGQPTSLEGWRQKIRNSISRLRLEFKFLLLPFLTQNAGTLCISEHLSVLESHQLDSNFGKAGFLFTILEREELSSKEISIRTRIPHTTAKRLLRKELALGRIIVNKKGRQYFYRQNARHFTPHD